MNFIIEDEGILVNEKGEKTPLKVWDFGRINPDEKHQKRNNGDKPLFPTLRTHTSKSPKL